jgi:predicted transport protein
VLLYFIKRYMVFTNKINFGNLRNFVTVGCDFSQVKLQLKMNYPEMRQIAENTRVNLLSAMYVIN